MTQQTERWENGERETEAGPVNGSPHLLPSRKAALSFCGVLYFLMNLRCRWTVEPVSFSHTLPCVFSPILSLPVSRGKIHQANCQVSSSPMFTVMIKRMRGGKWSKQDCGWLVTDGRTKQERHTLNHKETFGGWINWRRCRPPACETGVSIRHGSLACRNMAELCDEACLSSILL